MKAFPIPLGTVGPGSQPVGERSFDFIRVPTSMTDFAMPLPSVAEPAAVAEARAFIEELYATARRHDFAGGRAFVRDLAVLGAGARRVLDEALGEGEVAGVIEEPSVRLQETGFPGFWRVRTFDDDGRLSGDVVEVGPAPSVIEEAALLGSRCRMPKRATCEGAVNAPAILAELVAASARGIPVPAHVVNLTLLPVSPEEVQWLVAALEIGPVTLLARGYGNCRITSTRLRHAWWVQYFDGMDRLILNTVEVTPVPDVALAAPEDCADSVDRLGEWLATPE